MNKEIQAKIKSALASNIATSGASQAREELQERYEIEAEYADSEYGLWACIKLLSDLIEKMRSAGVVISPGYGHLTCSFLLHLAGVTNVNPVEWDLPFWRFLHPFILGNELKLETGTGGIAVAEKVLLSNRNIISFAQGTFQFIYREGNVEKTFLLNIIEYPEIDCFKSTLQDGWHRLDETTLRLFRSGQTEGSIWFESGKMREWLIDFCPESMSDLVLLRTLYYPRRIELFPEILRRKKNPNKIPSTGEEDADDILRDTYGLLVYQEQAMLLTDIGFLHPNAIGKISKWNEQIYQKALSPVVIPYNQLAVKGHEIARTMLSIEALWSRNNKKQGRDR